MKIILSRKGFDSVYGGQPSPILPDGTLLSLPIPYKQGIKFSKPKYFNHTYLDIIKQLKPNTKIDKLCFCHLDPDIRIAAKSRNENWKGLFGQSSSAQSHLENKKVGIGDIFLFFGWFKKTEMTENGLRYIKKAPDLHVIFGFLQIGKIYKEKVSKIKDIEDHPHAFFDERKDCIYEASEFLNFDKSKLGYGTFNFNEKLVLTKQGETRSRWDFPDYFKEANISYHSKKSFKKNILTLLKLVKNS